MVIGASLSKPRIDELIIHNLYIIELVDSINRDGPDTPIHVIHYKKQNNSEQENIKAF